MAAGLCAIALVLLVDVSSSVNQPRWLLQRNGIANALSSEKVVHAIVSAAPVAITEIEWADTGVVVIPWTILKDKTDVINLSSRIMSQKTRALAGNTHMGAALNKAIQELKQAPCSANKEVIDISGDGATDDDEFPGLDTRGIYDSNFQNAIDSTPFSKMHALAEYNGIQINGLPIWSEQEPTVVDWYQDHVPTSGGFIVKAESFEDFEHAMIKKLSMEISWR